MLSLHTKLKKHITNLLKWFVNLKNRSHTIHCIGDSHVSVFSGHNKIVHGFPFSGDKLTPFRTYHIGPYLAFNLSSSNHISRRIIFDILSVIPQKSMILLCFGEIDCRNHLVKQSQIQNKSLYEIVQSCVEKYLHFILEIKNKGYKPIVWGPVATSNSEIIINQNPQFSSYGTYQIRNQSIKLFNNILEQKCAEENISFISILKFLLNDDMTSKSEYYLDSIHLSQNAIPIITKAFSKQFPELFS